MYVNRLGGVRLRAQGVGGSSLAVIPLWRGEEGVPCILLRVSKATRRVVIVSAAAAEDVKRRDELATHLVPLARKVGGEVWHEGRIAGGEPVATLEREVAQARAVVVMVSAELLAEERRFALVVQARARGARVVPVIMRSCLWKDTPLGDLEALPKNGTMVLFRDDPGEVWNEVATALEEV